MAAQVSHGGPPPDNTTRPARKCSFQTTRDARRITLPRTGSMAMSIDKTVIGKSVLYWAHSRLA
eukprot:853869-Pyramimonas_sp.AAC.2